MAAHAQQERRSRVIPSAGHPRAHLAPLARRATVAMVGVAVIVVAYAVLAYGYAVVTPAWNNPDEPAHFNYVAQLAETGSLPVLQQGDWNNALQERLKSVGFRGATPQEVAVIRYEAWQPPLYYLLGVIPYLAFAASGLSGQLLALRLFDAALGGLTLVVAHGVGRELFCRRASIPAGAGLALAVPATMAGVPMYTAMSASVTNDALANLVAVLLCLWMLRAQRDGGGTGHALGLGVLLGIALLTKLTLAVFAPLAALSLLYAGWRAGRRPTLVLRDLFLCGVVAALIWAPWLVRQGLVYGWTDLLASRRHDAVVVGQPRFPGWTAAHLQYWTTTMFHSFWAQFGWMAVVLPDRVYGVWGAFTLAATAGLAVTLGRVAERLAALGSWRERLRSLDPRPALLALLLLGMFAEVVSYNFSFIQAQGRYLFPALAPAAALLVLGWSSLLPRRMAAIGALGAAGSLLAFNAFVLVRFAAPALAG